MTQTIALIVNIALALGLLGALASVIRVAHRRDDSSARETLHPSQPLPLQILLADEEDGPDLARVA